MKTYHKSTLAWLIAGAVTVPLSGLLSGTVAFSQETAETQSNPTSGTTDAASQTDTAASAQAASPADTSTPADTAIPNKTASQTDTTQSSESASQPDTASQPQTGGDEHLDRDSPALGVFVGSCPGQGVCVHDVVMGSPAQRVGIERGDYILAINDKTVSTPKELKEVIEGLTSVDTVNVSVWRRGQKMTKQVTLAAEAKTLPNSRQAWLGVALADRDNGEPGVVIDQVHPNSPAEKSGLNSGDVVVQIGNEEVTSIDKFVETVRDLEPGAQVNLTVQRDDEEQQITVTLGQVGNAPLRWFRRPFGGPIPASPFNAPPFDRQSLDQSMRPLMPQAAPDVMEEMIDDMRAQIRSLQNEVDQLKRQLPSNSSSVPNSNNVPSSDNPSSQNSDLPEADQPSADLSSNEFNPADYVQLVVQRDGRGRGNHGDHDHGGHNHGDHGRGNQGNFQRPYNLPHLSNDWTGERYRYQDNRTYRYRVPYGPVYRYPTYYPYQYYQYRGRPYYYGGAYPYGYRGGVQIGPNFGIYW
ncbi:PDZ domain-containing protein [Novipirellula caenicola]|uniref:PDZ domain-containing protein n=1 Tax=Novipirellula caenicola TaxID=1536901 RepID=A0ABP9VL33_9BACT